VANLSLAPAANDSTVALILTICYLAPSYRFDFNRFTTLAALVGYRFASMVTAESFRTWRKTDACRAVGLCLMASLLGYYVLLIHKARSVGGPMELRWTLSVFSPFAIKARPDGRNDGT
jgi:hypothetical protein